MDPKSGAEEEEEEEEFGFSRNYFLARELGGGSGKKSSCKLSDLVDEQEMRAAASGIKLKHEKEIAALLCKYKELYSKWLFELRILAKRSHGRLLHDYKFKKTASRQSLSKKPSCLEVKNSLVSLTRSGFGLLMYGFGSKKIVLEDFASTMLMDYGVVVINGYLPSINLKQAMIAVAEVLQDQLAMRRKSSTGKKVKTQETFSILSMEDILLYLNEQHSGGNDSFVCIVINNIDGPALRDFESQLYLARIACCSHVRIVASIDHVNAPLLWDKKMVHTQFNWCWYHVPTFAPYEVEGVFFPFILASGSAAQSMKTALVVLQSLTPNAQSVFKVLAEHQLRNEKEEGTPITTLYAECRQGFLVSSQMTLNSHLTEFKDHELVKVRRHSDGQDCLFIPLSNEALKKLLQELV